MSDYDCPLKFGWEHLKDRPMGLPKSGSLAIGSLIHTQMEGRELRTVAQVHDSVVMEWVDNQGFKRGQPAYSDPILQAAIDLHRDIPWSTPSDMIASYLRDKDGDALCYDMSENYLLTLTPEGLDQLLNLRPNSPPWERKARPGFVRAEVNSGGRMKLTPIDKPPEVAFDYETLELGGSWNQTGVSYETLLGLLVGDDT